jgi:hypothetical protein
MAELELIPVTATELITGVAAKVVNVELADVALVPAEFAETTSKLYVVAAVNPVSVTECVVTKAALSDEEEP